MADFTKVNLRQDVEDMAPRFELEGVESHFARVPLALEHSGVSYFKLEPGFRFPFGHHHGEQEEVYVLIAGGATVRLDEDEVAMAPLDAVRIPAGAKRNVAAGPEGAELIAFGAPNTENKDAEMLPGWWGD